MILIIDVLCVGVKIKSLVKKLNKSSPASLATRFRATCESGLFNSLFNVQLEAANVATQNSAAVHMCISFVLTS